MAPERGERRLERAEPGVEQRRVGERGQAGERGAGLRVGLGADLRRLLRLVALERLERRGVLGERQVALAHQADFLLVPVELADAEENEQAEGDEHHRVAEEDARGERYSGLPAREWMRAGQPAFSTCWAAGAPGGGRLERGVGPEACPPAGGAAPASGAGSACSGGRVRRAISAASAAARSSTERSEAATSSAVSSVPVGRRGRSSSRDPGWRGGAGRAPARCG